MSATHTPFEYLPPRCSRGSTKQIVSSARNVLVTAQKAVLYVTSTKENLALGVALIATGTRGIASSPQCKSITSSARRIRTLQDLTRRPTVCTELSAALRHKTLTYSSKSYSDTINSDRNDQ